MIRFMEAMGKIKWKPLTCEYHITMCYMPTSCVMLSSLIWSDLTLHLLLLLGCWISAKPKKKRKEHSMKEEKTCKVQTDNKEHSALGEDKEHEVKASTNL